MAGPFIKPGGRGLKKWFCGWQAGFPEFRCDHSGVCHSHCIRNLSDSDSAGCPDIIRRSSSAWHTQSDYI